MPQQPRMRNTWSSCKSISWGLHKCHVELVATGLLCSCYSTGQPKMQRLALHRRVLVSMNCLTGPICLLFGVNLYHSPAGLSMNLANLEDAALEGAQELFWVRAALDGGGHSARGVAQRLQQRQPHLHRHQLPPVLSKVLSSRLGRERNATFSIGCMLHLGTCFTSWCGEHRGQHAYLHGYILCPRAQ